ncbi:MAG: NTP/NDP exchange transporter [Desulfovibrionales bacterium]
MVDISRDRTPSECTSRHGLLRKLPMRAGFLFFNFFLIVMALYQLKPASRSFFVGELGAGMLPYAWIGTALVMLVVISSYNRLLKRVKRLHMVLGTCLVIVVMLVGFRFGLAKANGWSVLVFYIFVDIFGVIMVEQFWSLTNSIYTTEEGRSWYGLVGTGGLAGGVLGGAFAAALIKYTPLGTADLLLTSAGVVGLVFGLTWFMGVRGGYCEEQKNVARERFGTGFRVILGSRYLALIAVLLLLAQMASQFVEYQFLSVVGNVHSNQEVRTTYLSMFFSVMGAVSIVVNLGVTPVIHRRLGTIAGLLVQPVVLALCSMVFMVQGTLLWSSITKISDRGLNYSVTRASRELLYVPIDPTLIFKAKAWIDMFGYRMFKVLGAVIILVFTQWLPVTVSVPGMSMFTIVTCLLWTGLILALRPDYLLYTKRVEKGIKGRAVGTAGEKNMAASN